MTTSGKWIGPLRACDSHGENLVFSVVRATCITAMAATGTVAGVVVCSVAWHSAGSVATTAITVIGGISGAATGVGAAAIRSIKRCGRELQTRCRNTIADVEASVTAVTELRTRGRRRGQGGRNSSYPSVYRRPGPWRVAPGMSGNRYAYRLWRRLPTRG